MSGKPGVDQANDPNTMPAGPKVSDDVVAQAQAVVAEMRVSLKDSIKDSVVDVGREKSGLLWPPLTPRHHRRPKP